MNKLASVIVWICAAIIAAIILGLYIVSGAVYLSVTWPYYLWRGAYRIAHPR